MKDIVCVVGAVVLTMAVAVRAEEAARDGDGPDRGAGLVETTMPTGGACGKMISDGGDITRAPGMVAAAPPVGGVVQVRVEFATASAALTPKGKAMLKPFGEALRSDRLRELCFRIEGHTDSVGNPERNLELSKRRAESVKTYLSKTYGIDPDRMVAVGYGANRLYVKPDTTATARQQNRRVEIANLGQDSFTRGADTQVRKDGDGMDADTVVDVLTTPAGEP